MHIWPYSLTIMIGVVAAWAVPMTDDPKGFHNIPWGTTLSSRQDLETLRSSPHIVEYLNKKGLSSFAGAEMSSIRYLSLDDQFARVVIRYEGEQIQTGVEPLGKPIRKTRSIPGQMAQVLPSSIIGAVPNRNQSHLSS